MATYYVDPVSGNNANAGTSLALAWATTQKALDTAIAGDVVLLCATGVETTAVQIDADTNTGTVDTPIKFVAANASGVVDGTRYTLRASASILWIVFANTPIGYVWFEGVDFDGNGLATSCAGNSLSSGTTAGWTFQRCRFFGATAEGFKSGTTALWHCVECDFFDNGTWGSSSTGARGPTRYTACRFFDNASHGCNVNIGMIFVRCQFYRNGGHGVYMDSNSSGTLLDGCVFAFNTLDGIELFSTTNRNGYYIINCVFLSNGGFGVDYVAGVSGRVWLFTNNCFHNNTSGETSLGVGNTPGIVIASDPLFMDTGAGTEDFRLQATSPLLGAGIGGVDIGPLGIAAEEIGGSSVPQRVITF